MSDPVTHTVGQVGWMNIATLATMVGTVLALLKFNQSTKEVAKRNGRVEEKVTNNAAVTGQIQTGLARLAEKNDSAHAAIHGRLNTLPCKSEGERVAKLEGIVDGLKKKDGP